MVHDDSLIPVRITSPAQTEMSPLEVELHHTIHRLVAEQHKLQKRIEDMDKELDTLARRGERYFQAFIKTLPGHYENVLWFHYTSGKFSIRDKFQAWCESTKNTVKPFDAEHWFRVFGLVDGDWQKAPVTDTTTTTEVQE